MSSHGMYGFGIPWIGGYMGIIILILVIVVVVFLVKFSSGTHKRGSHPNYWDNEYIDNDSEALRILKERYAKGEINKETFEKMKKDLIED